MFDTILIPTDGSTDARKGAKQGVQLAAQLGATVHGLYAVTDSSNPWERTSLADQREHAEAYGTDVVDEIRTLAVAADVEFVNAVRFGSRPFEVINDYVEEADIDLIAMGSGYHGEFGGLFGSTADKVLRTAHVPVMVLRRELRKVDDDKPAAVTQ